MNKITVQVGINTISYKSIRGASVDLGIPEAIVAKHASTNRPYKGIIFTKQPSSHPK